MLIVGTSNDYLTYVSDDLTGIVRFMLSAKFCFSTKQIKYRDSNCEFIPSSPIYGMKSQQLDS